MLGLPKSTEMSKQLPKKAIYTKFQMNTAAKDKIDADISRITIVNEITADKVNIPAGENVQCFFVLLVTLKRRNFDEKNIAMLSKLIPQNILFILEYVASLRYITPSLCKHNGGLTINIVLSSKASTLTRCGKTLSHR